MKVDFLIKDRDEKFTTYEKQPSSSSINHLLQNEMIMIIERILTFIILYSETFKLKIVS
jgi:hypothetical protein